MPIEQDAIDAITREIRRPASIPTPKLLGLSRLACKPGKNPEAALQRLFDLRYFVTDAYPEVTVVFLLRGGKTMELHSETQAPFGLPWTISFDSVVYRSYNPKISTAVARLLPADDLNHDPLARARVSGGTTPSTFDCT